MIDASGIPKMNHGRVWSLLFSFLLFAIPLLAASSHHQPDGSMNPAERKYLLTQLKSSEDGVLGAIHGLTQAQWTFKPSPETWSIQQCAEQIILAEDLILNEAQHVLETPPVPRLSNATSEGDRQVAEEMEDRRKKAKAPKVLQPSGRFPTPESAAAEFRKRRGKTIAYVKSTHDPLWIHAADGPSGSRADVYQFLLEIAAHSVRHTAGMQEVKETAGYPVP
jgi:hypothetical protein